MKTFPVQTSDKVRSEMTKFREGIGFPKFEWGKKIYILRNQEVRGAIPICAYMVNEPSRYSIAGENNIYVRFNIAGVGEESIKMSVIDRKLITGIKMFRSIEDYNAFFAGEKGREYIPDSIAMEDIVRIHGMQMRETDTWYYQVLGWEMGQFEPQRAPICFKDVWCDVEGVHITFVPKSVWGISGKYYLTKEDCLADNRRGVVDFEDEFIELATKEYTIPVSLTVTATSQEDAERKAREICGSSLTI